MTNLAPNISKELLEQPKFEKLFDQDQVNIHEIFKKSNSQNDHSKPVEKQRKNLS